MRSVLPACDPNSAPSSSLQNSATHNCKCCILTHYVHLATAILFARATTNLLQLHSGCTESETMLCATTYPARHLLTCHQTSSHKAPAHLYFKTYGQKAAAKLHSARYLELEVPGQIGIQLTPGAVAGATRQFALVSTPFPKSRGLWTSCRQAYTLLQHSTRLTPQMQLQAHRCAPTTPCFYDNTGAV